MNTSISALFMMPGLVGGMCSLWLAVVTLQRRPGVGWQFLVLAGAGVALWCFSQIAWVLAASERTAAHVLVFQFAAVSLAAIAWLLHALCQTGRRNWLRNPLMLVLLAIPAWAVAVAMRAEVGEPNLLWEGLLGPPDTPVMQVLYGPGFWVFIAHTYLLFLGGCAILLSHYAQSALYRDEVLMTAAFPLLLLAANALYVAGYWPVPLDPAPLGFGLGFAMFGWAMERRGLFELSPVGRRLAFDALHEGVLIVDMRGRIIDANPASCRLLGRNNNPAIGKALNDVLPLESRPVGADLRWEMDLRLGEGWDRRIQIDSSPITDQGGRVRGSVLTLRDVTRERVAQQQLLSVHRHLRKLNSELRRMAQIDSLTGLANRRMLMDRLGEEFSRARRYSMPLALLLIDLDYFKQVNDCRGHLIGDAVLSATASALDALKRPADLAARYGGEEMVLLLPETDLEGARGAATRVWRTLRAISHVDTDGSTFRVTASIGLATLCDADASPESLLARADAALYAAKNQGRDRIAVALAEEFEVYVPNTAKPRREARSDTRAS